MTQVQPIPTRYAGHHFRSRLEARWAVFFDHLGIAWRYEPQGYLLPSGRYLPDFLLPDIGWFEVKGERPADTEYREGPDGLTVVTPARECQLAGELADATGKRVFLAWGDLPRSVDLGGHDPYDDNRGIDMHASDWSGDVDYAFAVCPWCDRVGLEYESRAARICGYKVHGYANEAAALAAIWGQGWTDWRADDKCYRGNHPRILAAYEAARSARFEYGQRGAT